MTQAVILHTIEDVKHCLKHGLHKNAMLFSTNVNVVYYLKDQRGIECHDLCAYMEPSEILRIQYDTLRLGCSLLKELDQQIAPELNKQFELSMQYFAPLYSTTGTWQLAFYVLLITCLERMLEEHEFLNILFYDGSMGPMRDRMENFLSQTFGDDTRIQIVRYEVLALPPKTTVTGFYPDEIQVLSQKYCKDQAFNSAVLKQQGEKKETVLVFEPVDRLGFLVQKDNDCNVYAVNPSRISSGVLECECSREIMPCISSLQSLDVSQVNIKNSLILLYEIICKDFCRNIAQYMQTVYFYKKLHKGTPIRYVYWDHVPRQGYGALLLDYFLTNGETKVVGVQSKSTFWAGKMNGPYAFVNILNRCHFFLTQGVTKKDMEMLYCRNFDKPEIVTPKVDFAGGELAAASKVKDDVDVAFYLQPTPSFFASASIFANIKLQEALLRFLDRCQNKKVHIVCHQNPNFDNCALISLVKTLKNVTLVNDASLHDYVKKYTPKVIIADSTIPFLEDVLHEDVDVIIIKNAMSSFSHDALCKLETRAYYAEDLAETQALLSSYFDGKLAKKRDAAYVCTYCNKQGIEETVQQFSV